MRIFLRVATRQFQGSNKISLGPLIFTQITTDIFKPSVLVCTIPSLLKSKIESKFPWLDKLQKLKISLKVTQMAQNTKVAIEDF
jgi:hypothetical protein